MLGVFVEGLPRKQSENQVVSMVDYIDGPSCEMRSWGFEALNSYIDSIRVQSACCELSINADMANTKIVTTEISHH